MEERIKVIEERINVLETVLLKDPWEILLDDVVNTYIKVHYPYVGSYNSDLYLKVLESMEEQIKTLLMGGNH